MSEDEISFPISRNTVTMRVSEEWVAMEHGFSQLGHHEPVTPTAEQIAQHARAVELVAEIESNPYVRLGGYDYELDVEPLTTERWVADETHEEWMTRWREHRATHPDEKPPRSPLDRMITGAFSRAFDHSPLLGLTNPTGDPE